MTKKIILTLIIVAIVVVSYSAYNQPTIPAQQDVDVSQATQLTRDTRYTSYMPNTFDELSSRRRVLFFYASWCPTCIAADNDFNSNTATIPPDVSIIRVNYRDDDTDDAERDLARRYGVTYQHTFVQIDERNEVVTRWNGGSIEQLLANLK